MQEIELPPDGTPLLLPNAKLRYFEQFFDPITALHYFDTLLKETP